MALEYDAASILQQIRQLESRVAQLATITPFIPLPVAPSSPSKGWVALSDGTASIESFGGSGEGLYRYTGSAWVFVG